MRKDEGNHQARTRGKGGKNRKEKRVNKKRRLERQRLQGGRATRQKMAHGTFCPDEGPKQSTIAREEPRESDGQESRRGFKEKGGPITEAGQEKENAWGISS